MPPMWFSATASGLIMVKVRLVAIGVLKKKMELGPQR
jgi:hypothetical protein